MPNGPLRLQVDRVGFVRGFRAIQAAERREWRRATVTFEGGKFQIQLGAVTVLADATGTWEGEVRITGRDFRRLNVEYSVSTDRRN